jgi:hypothetical protein
VADVTDLRQLVLRRLAELDPRPGKSLSHRDAAARSGGRISHATIGNITSGRHGGKLDDKTVEGLALALDLPRSEILRATYRSSQVVVRPFEAPESWQKLTHAQRKVVIAVGNGLLDAYEQGHDDAAEARQMGEVRPLRRVASGKADSPMPEREQAAERAAREAAARNPRGKRPPQ